MPITMSIVLAPACRDSLPGRRMCSSWLALSHKMAPVLKRIYDQMAEPKWVVSFGVCTCTGGFYDNYATVMGIDTIILWTFTSRAVRRGRGGARWPAQAPGQNPGRARHRPATCSRSGSEVA